MHNVLERLAELVAPRLLGSYLVREIDGQKVIGKIVETEAYGQDDAASHSYRGQTLRTAVMFGPPGFAYVYFTYGMHYCVNVVTGPPGHGSAVLIRALEPVDGLEVIKQKRPKITDDHQLTNGPAKLCQALGIDKTLDGHNLSKPPLELIIKPPIKSSKIAQTTRIGISHDIDRPWRFYINDNEFVSRS